MRILTFSSLYPNAVQPHHGVFVENRLRQIRDLGGASFRVVAPIPWFPSRAPIFGRYARLAKVAPRETRHDVEVLHPRYPAIPKIGMTIAPALLDRWMRPVLERLIAAGEDFDLIDAHYFYPDGVAAARLAARLGKPLVITARGSDINRISRYSRPRRMIQQAAAQADAVITVSEALRQALIDLGGEPESIITLRNGVDLSLFGPQDGEALKTTWDLTGPLLLSVGNLVPLKNHDQVIRALSELPEARLAIVGGGPEEARLRALAVDLGVQARVRFLGILPHEADGAGLFCGRCSGSGLEQRRLAQRPLGGYGLRHAGRGHCLRRHPGARHPPRSGPSDRFARGPSDRPRGQGLADGPTGSGGGAPARRGLRLA